jgi:hypothetical protein
LVGQHDLLVVSIGVIVKFSHCKRSRVTTVSQCLLAKGSLIKILFLCCMPSERIPVEFEYAGRAYTGYFTAPHGAGGKTWFLRIDGYHRGQLMSTEKNGWQFYSKDGTFKEPTDFFADVITAWYE